MAGLGAGRAQRYFAPELDRSNRLIGWRERIEAVAILRANSQPYCTTRLVLQRRTGQGKGKSSAKVN
jgi:hypothetical protein